MKYWKPSLREGRTSRELRGICKNVKKKIRSAFKVCREHDEIDRQYAEARAATKIVVRDEATNRFEPIIDSQSASSGENQQAIPNFYNSSSGNTATPYTDLKTNIETGQFEIKDVTIFIDTDLASSSPISHDVSDSICVLQEQQSLEDNGKVHDEDVPQESHESMDLVSVLTTDSEPNIGGDSASSRCSLYSLARPLEECTWPERLDLEGEDDPSMIVPEEHVGCTKDEVDRTVKSEVRSQDYGSEGDPLEQFRDVIDVLDLEKVRTIALSLRRNQVRDFDWLLDCTISDTPKCGSYNLVYTITFTDGVKWCARVPGYGKNLVDSLDEKFNVEYSTMRYIRKNSTFPLPEVYYWTSDTSEAGAAFGLIEFLEGTQLVELWWDRENFGEEKRKAVLLNIAEHMQKLYKMQFENTGMLRWNTEDPESACEIGPALDYFDDGFCYWAGTITLQQQDNDFGKCLKNAKQTLQNEDVTAPNCSANKALKLLVESVPNFAKKVPLSLSLQDLDLQNVFVDPDTASVTGFIDLDGVAVRPAHIGAAAYPLWLTRDMDPSHYIRPLDPNEIAPFQDSPQELNDLRSWYGICWEALEEAHGLENYNPQWTADSHILTSIYHALNTIELREPLTYGLVDYAYGEGFGLTNEARAKLWAQCWNDFERWQLRAAIGYGPWFKTAKRAFCVNQVKNLGDDIMYFAKRPKDYWKAARAMLNV